MVKSDSFGQGLLGGLLLASNVKVYEKLLPVLSTTESSQLLPVLAMTPVQAGEQET